MCIYSIESNYLCFRVHVEPIDKPMVGIPVTKDRLPDQLFKLEDLSSDEQLHMTMFMAHFFLMYVEAGNSSAIELPAGITHANRVIVHHITDKLGLGSFTRGSKGTNKRILVAPMDLNRNKFEKAKRGRDTIITNAIKSYRFKTYDPPEVTVQKETYRIVEEQIENKKKGLDFTQSWNLVLSASDAQMKQVVDERKSDEEVLKKTAKDGKDWSLSTDEFQIYIAGENKEVVNKGAFDESDAKVYNSEFINPLNPGPNLSNDEGMYPELEGPREEVNESMEEEEDEYMSEEDNYLLEPKTNNIDPEMLDKMTLEDFEGRPDKITKVEIVAVTAHTVELKWEVPECNNAPITEYTIKCKEMNSETLESTFKSIYRSETNSVTLEDLKEDTWHTIDVRAVNKYGYCPQSANL